MVKFDERFDYYELLRFDPEDLTDLDPEEIERFIEKAYKETARKRHPDKRPKEEYHQATAEFQELHKAYEVLKDPIQRADYDLYRKKNTTPATFTPDLVPTEGLRFSGYSDDEDRNFYKVYSVVFQRIHENEVAFQHKKNMHANSVTSKSPDMGDEFMPYSVVVQFYNFWLNFSTVMDFTWEDPYDEYDLAAAPRKKGMAAMVRKNVKARKRARNEFNNKVRRLAGYAKKRDIRVLEMMARRAEERKREVEEEKERKMKAKKEKQEKAMEYEEPEWTKPVERRRKYAVEEKEEEEREEWECVVCRKDFKSEQQCRNHEMSKRHRDMVAAVMGLEHRDLVDKFREIMEEDGDSDDEELNEDVNDAKEDVMDVRVVDEGDKYEVLHFLRDYLNDLRAVDKEDDCVFVGEEVEVEEDDDEEEEEVVNDGEMEVLEAMVARLKSMVNVSEPKFEPPMATIIDGNDEVAMDADQSTEKKPKRRRRRSVKSTSTGLNELDATSDMKVSKSESSAESCVENGSEDEGKRRKGGKKEKRSKRSGNGESEVSDQLIRNARTDAGVGEKKQKRIYYGKKDRNTKGEIIGF